MEIHLNLPGRGHQRHSRPRRAGSPGATPAGHSVTPSGADGVQPRTKHGGARQVRQTRGGDLRIEPGDGERRPESRQAEGPAGSLVVA
jgi:hypothetical protein